MQVMMGARFSVLENEDFELALAETATNNKALTVSTCQRDTVTWVAPAPTLTVVTLPPGQRTVALVSLLGLRKNNTGAECDR